MSDEYSWDGQPIQAGLQNRSVVLSGNARSYSMFGLHEMVVVDRKYVGEPGNRSHAQVVYACRNLHTGDVIQGCRRLDVMSGQVNGDDDVLHPSTTPLPGTKLSKTGIAQTPAQSTDGDRVLVGFIGGSRIRPVIVDVFRHSLAQYGATKADGERRLTTHMGTNIEIKKDGQYVITHKSGATININEDRKSVV